MGPGCPLKPTGRWLVSSRGLGVRKVEWGLLWTALSLGLMERGSGKGGLGHHSVPGYRSPWSSLDVDTHLTCLLSWKILFSPGLLIKAMGACAQEGEGIFPHLGLLNFISFLV